jgi:hypothetical protein
LSQPPPQHLKTLAEEWKTMKRKPNPTGKSDPRPNTSKPSQHSLPIPSPKNILTRQNDQQNQRNKFTNNNIYQILEEMQDENEESREKHTQKETKEQHDEAQKEAEDDEVSEKGEISKEELETRVEQQSQNPIITRGGRKTTTKEAKSAKSGKKDGRKTNKESREENASKERAMGKQHSIKASRGNMGKKNPGKNLEQQIGSHKGNKPLSNSKLW